MSDSTQDTDVEPCIVCGKDVVTQEPGMPKARALCDLTCMKIWCATTGSELVSMEDYLRGR